MRPAAQLGATTVTQSADDPREPYVWLGLGLVTAPIFALTPLLQIMGWFVSALVHEMGHAAMGWFFGTPAIPAIRLDGHAAAFHQGQLPWLVLVIAVCLGATGWRVFGGTRGRAVTLGLVALYLAVAFSPLHESLFLLAGHGGEYVIAAVFLWRCAVGGFVHSRAERLLYGTLGWFLLGENLLLSGRLLFSAMARSDYAGSGSFGLTNDYLRMGLPLPLVAGAMGLVGIAIVPLVLYVIRPNAES